MKSIVIYYSWTGNTKQIAEAIYAGMKEMSDKSDIARLQEVDENNLLNYELIGLGAPVIDFQEPSIVTDFIKSMTSLKGKYGFSFCTHGTCPNKYIVRTVSALRRKGLIVTGWNDWYGSVFIPYFMKPYYTDGHPDIIDIKEAEAFGKEIVERSQRISRGETRLIPRLPGKDKYEKLYGIRPDLKNFPGYERRITQEDMDRIKPRLDIDKCRYPKCTICMDNCPTNSINPSRSPAISRQTCGPCLLFFCEQLCPTGAIEVDWGPLAKRAEFIKPVFHWLGKLMKKHKELRRFRSLISAEEGSDKPLFKINKHPRLILRDGVARVRS